MSAYYNENDPEKCAALEAMMRDGHIAAGRIDDRDIRDVAPEELLRYDQCHFFAGVGLWSAALRLAGVPDDCRIWTGSPPCQPFSAIGDRAGLGDERHLWPAFFWHIYQCAPDRVVGEQVASADGLAWLDIVCADMEAAGYAGGAIDLCSAGFGAPNIRQRLYFAFRADRRLGHSERSRLEGYSRHVDQRAERAQENRSASPTGSLGDDGRKGDDLRCEANGFWSDCDLVAGRANIGPVLRPVEPGSCGLAPRHPGRDAALRAWGDGINLQLAAEFIGAVRPEVIDL